VILVLSLLTTTEWARRTAAQTAARFREGGLPARYAQGEAAPG
jgi:hypothetical protein